MTQQWQVLMPKTQIFRGFTQSSAQALALDPNRRTTLRLRAEFDATVAPTELKIDVEEATVAEETAFVTSATKQVLLGNSAAVVNTQATLTLAFSGPFVRLKIVATTGLSTWANIQAEVLVQ